MKKSELAELKRLIAEQAHQKFFPIILDHPPHKNPDVAEIIDDWILRFEKCDDDVDVYNETFNTRIKGGYLSSLGFANAIRSKFEWLLGEDPEAYMTNILWDLSSEAIDRLFNIAEDHGKSFFSKWVQHVESNQRGNFRFFQDFVRRGLFEQDTTTNEFLLSLIPHGSYCFIRQQSQFYTGDDAPIWRFFEYEGTSEMSLTNGGREWAPTLIELSEEGLVCRQRLLQASLEALNRDFIQNRAGWFSRFHTSLKPTVKEIRQNRDLYLMLCGSPIPPTVSFALKLLAKLQKSNPLSVEDCVNSISQAVFASSKATASNAIKLIHQTIQLTTKEPEREDLYLLLVQGLSHESPDVQELILQLLTKNEADKKASIASSLNEYRELIAPSLKHYLVSGSEDDQAAAVDFDPDQIDEQWISGKELKKFEQANENRIVYFPIEDQKSYRKYLLDNTPPFSHVESLEELVQKAQECLEAPEDIGLMDQVIAGLAKFADQRPDEFSALKKQSVNTYKRGGSSHPEHNPHNYTYLIAYLILIWLDVIDEDSSSNYRSGYGFEGYWGRWIDCLAKKLTERKPFEVLAIPSHGTWIATREFNKRLKRAGSFDDADIELATGRLLAGGNANGSETVGEILARLNSKTKASIKIGKKSYGSDETYTKTRYDCDLNISDLYESEYHRVEAVHLSRGYFPFHVNWLHYQIGYECSGYYSWKEAGMDRVLNLELVYQPWDEWGDLGSAMLSSLLFSCDPFLQALSAELLEQLISDRRISPETLGERMFHYCTDGLGTFKRVQKSFQQIQHASLAHQWFLIKAISHTVVKIEVYPRDFSAMLEVLLELLVTTGVSLEDEVKTKLSNIKGSSKLAKLARKCTVLENKRIEELAVAINQSVMNNYLSRIELFKANYA